jgi:glycosyltransferase involved in cell wall biosynthesis
VKPRILVLVAYYLPGVKSGGPIRSISNLVEALGDEMDFRIVTSDRDEDDDEHYPGITPDRWTTVGKAEVLYLSPGRQGLRSIFRLLASEKADFLYLNSFFGKSFSIFPLLVRAWGARGQKSVLLAPRGEFSNGALRLKSGRKKAWIRLAKRLAGYRDLTWHASSLHEERDIRQIFGGRAAIRVALPTSQSNLTGSVCPPKPPGSLKVVFVARISPMKNLLQAIEMLHDISGDIEFNIYGPEGDGAYWSRCQQAVRELPNNVRVEFRSLVEHSAVPEILAAHHLFLLPTLGENYGHSIAEALGVGCPVLISDRTPWRGLESAGAGWDLPLDRPDLFREALEKCVRMTTVESQTMRDCARAYFRRVAAVEDVLNANRALFSLGGAGEGTPPDLTGISTAGTGAY